jgi:hypothetical protein
MPNHNNIIFSEYIDFSYYCTGKKIISIKPTIEYYDQVEQYIQAYPDFIGILCCSKYIKDKYIKDRLCIFPMDCHYMIAKKIENINETNNFIILLKNIKQTIKTIGKNNELIENYQKIYRILLQCIAESYSIQYYEQYKNEQYKNE